MAGQKRETTMLTSMYLCFIHSVQLWQIQSDRVVSSNPATDPHTEGYIQLNYDGLQRFRRVKLF